MARNPDRIPVSHLINGGLAFTSLGGSPQAGRFTWSTENLPVIIGALAFLSRIHDRRMAPLSH